MKIQRNQRSGKKAIIASLSIAVAALFGYIALNYQATDDSIALSGIQAKCGDDQALFYPDAGLKGKVLEMNTNWFYEVKPGKDMRNDCISSFQIGKNVRAHLCQNENCAGQDQWNAAADIVGPYTVNYIQDINDWISHIRLYRYDRSDVKYVQAFSLAEFTAGHAGIFSVGTHSSLDILNAHLNLPGNHGSIAGLVVPEGLVATIYDQDYQNGQSQVLIGPIEVDFVKGKYLNLRKWNNRIRSMKIKKDDLTVECKWDLILDTNAGSLEIETEIGTYQANYEEYESNTDTSFSASISGGYKFIDVGLSYERSEHIRQYSTQTFEEKKWEKTKLDCPDMGLPVALYQWKMIAKRSDHKDLILSAKSRVCKYGEDFRIPPKCPISYCKDAECRVCTYDEPMVQVIAQE